MEILQSQGRGQCRLFPTMNLEITFPTGGDPLNKVFGLIEAQIRRQVPDLTLLIVA
jgi:hypothetical protein